MIVSICFPKEGRITDHSKAERFSLKAIVQSSKLQRYRAKCIKQQASKNDRPDESLTGQAHVQAGHCLLTSRYFEPYINT